LADELNAPCHSKTIEIASAVDYNRIKWKLEGTDGTEADTDIESSGMGGEGGDEKEEEEAKKGRKWRT